MSVPKKHKLRDIYPLTFPRVPPYNSIGEYLTSKAYLSGIHRNCQWEQLGGDPELFLTASRRVYNFMNSKLEAKREWAKEQQKKLDEQWEALYNDEAKFKETLLTMTNFVKTNHDKRVRAENALNADRKVVEQRTKENDSYANQINDMTELEKEMETAIQEMIIYERYLDKVVNFSEKEFKNADEIISRFESLVSTKALLGKRQDENLCLLETARAKTARMIEDFKFKIIGLNNTVADLNSRYNTAFRKAVHWENIVLAIKKNCFDKYQEITAVKIACWNLYLLMCKRKNETPKLEEDDLESLLLYIKKTLQELLMVKKMISTHSHSDVFSRRRSRKSTNTLI